MSSIDNRVVLMEFNNREFEKGVSVTIKTLENLDDKINNLGKNSANKSALKQLGDDVDNVTNKFSAMEATLTGIFIRLGSEITDLGLKLVNSVAVEPLTEGFSKYEALVKSTAGLLNTANYYYPDSDGYTEDQRYQMVQDYLQKIQWYADATSFSMDAMTSAYQAAVNAGTDMEVATAVIMGMGNAFMYAGATATEMDGAFAMLSKVMSDEANLNKMVYNSLSRVYHVITPEFQDRMVKTALDMGKITQAEADLYKSDFAGSLEKKWLTGDIMKEVYVNQYGKYVNQLYAFVEAWEDGSISLSDSTARMADSMGAYVGEVQTVYQYMDLFDAEMEASGYTIDEWSRRTFEASMEAKTLSEAVDALKDQLSTEWAKIYTAIIGDYDKAKELWGNFQDFIAGLFVTPLSNFRLLIQKFAEGVREIEGELYTGREILFKIIDDVWRAIQAITTPIQNAWNNIFKPLTSERLLDIVTNVEKFTKALILPENIQIIFEALYTQLFHIGQTILNIGKFALNAFGKLYSAIKPGLQALGDFLNYIILGVDWLIQVVTQSGLLENILTKIELVLYPIEAACKKFFDNMDLGETILNAVCTAIGAVVVVFEDLSGVFKLARESLKYYMDYLGGEVGNLFTKFADKVKYASLYMVGAVAYALEAIPRLFGQFMTWIGGGLGSLWTKVTELASKAKTLFEGINVGDFVDKLAAIVKKLEPIFKQLATEAITLTVIAKRFIKIRNLFNFGSIIAGIGKASIGIGEFIQSAGKIVDEIEGFARQIKWKIIFSNVKSLGKALLYIASAMLVISIIPKESLVRSAGLTIALIAILGGIILALGKIFTDPKTKLLDSNSAAKIFNGLAKAFAGIGLAIVLIAVAMKTIDSIGDWKKQGLVFIEMMLMLVGLVHVTRVLGKAWASYKEFDKVGVMMLKMASGILILAKAMQVIASIEDPVQLVTSFVMIIAILSVMGLVGSLMEKNAGMFESVGKLGGVFIAMAVAMLIIGGAMKIFATMNFDEAVIAVGSFIIIAGMFAMISKELTLASASPKAMLSYAGSMLILAGAMLAMSVAIAAIGIIPQNVWLQGFGTITALMVLLGFITQMFKNDSAKNLLIFSGAVVVMSIALTMMTGALTIIGLLPWKRMVMGFSVLIVLITSFAIFMNTIKASEPGKLALFGAGMIAIAAGLVAIGLACTFFSLISWETLGKAGAVLLSVFMVLAAGGVITEALALPMIKFVGIMAALAVVLLLFSHVLKSFVDVFDKAGVLIDTYCPKISDKTRDFADAITKMAIATLEFTGAATLAILPMFVFALALALFGKSCGIAGEGLKDLYDGAKPIVDYLGDKFDAIGTKVTNAGTKLKNFFDKWGDSLTEYPTIFEDPYEAGQYWAQGLSEGIEDGEKEVGNAATGLAKKIEDEFRDKAKIKSPSEVARSLGLYWIAGLLEGIEDGEGGIDITLEGIVDSIKTKTAEIKSTVNENGGLIETLKNKAQDYIDSFKGEDSITSSISSVIDLTDFQSGTSTLSDILNNIQMDLGSSSLSSSLSDLSSSIADSESSSNSITSILSGIEDSLTSEHIADYISEALSGTGVYMDGKKVGKLVTTYQMNSAKSV